MKGLSLLRDRRVLLVFALALVLVVLMTGTVLAAKPDNLYQEKNLAWNTVLGGNADSLGTGFVPGKVNLNTPQGSVVMQVTGSITLAPNTTYWVWVRDLTDYTGPSVNDDYSSYGWYALGYFTTDEFGAGSFHYNITDAMLPSGLRTIQVAVNGLPDSWPSGHTVAATGHYSILVD